MKITRKQLRQIIKEAHGLSKSDSDKIKDLADETDDPELKRILKFIVKSNVEVDVTQDVTKMKKESTSNSSKLERIVQESIDREKLVRYIAGELSNRAYDIGLLDDINDTDPDALDFTLPEVLVSSLGPDPSQEQWSGLAKAIAQGTYDSDLAEIAETDADADTSSKQPGLAGSSPEYTLRAYKENPEWFNEGKIKITKGKLEQIIKEALDPDLLKGAYVSSREDREAFKDYIAKVKAKRMSMSNYLESITSQDMADAKRYAKSDNPRDQADYLGIGVEDWHRIRQELDDHYEDRFLDDQDAFDDDYPKVLGYEHPVTGENVMISVQSDDDMDDILDPLLRQYPDLAYSVD